MGNSISKVVCLTLLLCSLSGCGVVGGAGNHISAAFTRPSGKLYSPEFYKKATPDMVRKAMEGVDMANEFHDEEYVVKPGGFVPPGYQTFVTMHGIFVTDTEKKTRRVYPLDVAAYYSPYPEVTHLMRAAGAQYSSDQAREILSPSQWTLCKNLASYAEKGDMQRIESLLRTASVNSACCEALPLIEAIRVAQNDIALFFLARDSAELQEFVANNTLIKASLNFNNMDMFWVFQKHGSDTSDVSLLAEMGMHTDDAVADYLAESVSVEGKDGHRALGFAIWKEKPAMFKRLVERGADCATMDAELAAKLLYNALRFCPKDTFVAWHLVEYLTPSAKDGGPALTQACAIGDVGLVQCILNKGVRPDWIWMERHGSPNAKAIRKLLTAHGIEVKLGSFSRFP